MNNLSYNLEYQKRCTSFTLQNVQFGRAGMTVWRCEGGWVELRGLPSLWRGGLGCHGQFRWSCYFTSECRWSLSLPARRGRHLNWRGAGLGSGFSCGNWTRPCRVCPCLLFECSCGARCLTGRKAVGVARGLLTLERRWWTYRCSGCHTERPSSARTADARSA